VCTIVVASGEAEIHRDGGDPPGPDGTRSRSSSGARFRGPQGEWRCRRTDCLRVLAFGLMAAT
jgi:hypothetical protein